MGWLSPEVDRMASNGKKVRKVQQTDSASVREVLSGTPTGGSSVNGVVRLFGTAAVQDTGRVRGPEDGTGEYTGDGTVRSELQRLLRLPVGTSVDADITPEMTGNEALARILLRKAINDRSQAAIDAVLDRLEGKPVRAAANKTTNAHIDEQLDLQLDALNGLVPESDGEG